MSTMDDPSQRLIEEASGGVANPHLGRELWSIGGAEVLTQESPIQHICVTVTPEVARCWLANQMPNRNVKKGNVARWARDIQSGAWKAIAHGIQFDADGRLIDGQNRLHAVVRSGKSVPMWVALDVPTDHIPLMDIGTSRTTADVLGIVGVEITNKSKAVAAANSVLSYERWPNTVWNSQSNPISVQETLDEIEQHLQLYRDGTHDGNQLRRAPGGLTPGLWLNVSTYTALHVLVNKYSPNAELLPRFHEGLVTRAGLAVGDPRIVLTSARITTKFGGMQSGVMACIKAWNAWARGQQLTKLYVSSSHYLPMPELA